ncbi:MAG: ribosomal protein S18-alanine N-acetyltransferase [Actinomycetota bacterium]|nr:ribosomal protein S18-alanine N-acetyltransferase [Actinomycetota bacterium]
MSELEKPDLSKFLNSLDLTTMRKRHLDMVLDIEHRAYQNPWSRTVFESELSQGITRSYIVALNGRVVVGYCGVLYVVDEAHITNIAVDPNWHRMHIGTRLLSDMVRRAWNRRIGAITLEVRVSNFNAQRLYQKFGFQPAGVRKGYYQESNEDALIMWAYDVDSPEYHERLLNIEAQAGIVVESLRRRRHIWS